jgi:hypothetical protein
MKKKKLMMALLLFASIKGFSQENANAAGGNIAGVGGSVAYSVGQVVYTTNTGLEGSVSQGVQQPYEVSIVLGAENPSINLVVQAYPNPTQNYLTLNVGNNEISNLNFQLIDVNGRLIENKKISNAIEVIDMEKLQAAVYFLKVARNNKEIKNFKIIKN